MVYHKRILPVWDRERDTGRRRTLSFALHCLWLALPFLFDFIPYSVLVDWCMLGGCTGPRCLWSRCCCCWGCLGVHHRNSWISSCATRIGVTSSSAKRFGVVSNSACSCHWNVSFANSSLLFFRFPPPFSVFRFIESASFSFSLLFSLLARLLKGSGVVSNLACTHSSFWCLVNSSFCFLPLWPLSSFFLYSSSFFLFHIVCSPCVASARIHSQMTEIAFACFSSSFSCSMCRLLSFLILLCSCDLFSVFSKGSSSKSDGQSCSRVTLTKNQSWKRSAAQRTNGPITTCANHGGTKTENRVISSSTTGVLCLSISWLMDRKEKTWPRKCKQWREEGLSCNFLSFRSVFSSVGASGRLCS